jgi:replicative DNA helicase
MPNEAIGIRMLAARSKIEARQIRKGFIRPDDWPKLTCAAESISQSKVYFDDSPLITPSELRMRARKAKKDFDIKLLVLDYLQIMVSSGSHKNREQEVAEISRTLKSIARELNIPVIGVSQLNRGVDARPNKRPLMSDLRESGAIEQDADLILFIYRDEVYNSRDDNPEKGIAEISIGKQRHGPTATIKTVFSGKYQKFSDVVYDSYDKKSKFGYND